MATTQQQTQHTSQQTHSQPPQQQQPGVSKGKAVQLTPLKGVDKNLETDDTLFTESFVRKFSPRSMPTKADGALARPSAMVS